jgi:hypothetical protein
MATDLSCAAEGGMNPLKIKYWIGLRREPEEEAAQSKPGKGLFWR